MQGSDDECSPMGSKLGKGGSGKGLGSVKSRC